MTTASPVYSSPVTFTWTLTGLASSSLDAGREATATDNKDTDDAIDVLIGGKFRLGTSPTAARTAIIALLGSYDDTEFGGGAAGNDAALTPDEMSLVHQLIGIPTIGTTGKDYHWGPFSAGRRFGGVIPVRWAPFITHNTGVNLDATASNFEAVAYPVKFESS